MMPSASKMLYQRLVTVVVVFSTTVARAGADVVLRTILRLTGAALRTVVTGALFTVSVVTVVAAGTVAAAARAARASAAAEAAARSAASARALAAAASCCAAAAAEA